MVWKPHVTVAAVIPRENRFLLVEETIDGMRVYNQPAGHLEPGESLLDAVIRETAEETGLDFLPEAITGVYRWAMPDTQRTFLRVTFAGAAAEPPVTRALDPEIEQTLWLTREQVAASRQRLRSPMVLACIDGYLAGRRYPLDLLQDIA